MVIIPSLQREIHTEVIKYIINLLHVKECLFRSWKEKCKFLHNLGFAFPGILNATNQPCLQAFPLEPPQRLYHLLTFYLLLFFLLNMVENLFCLKIKNTFISLIPLSHFPMIPHSSSCYPYEGIVNIHVCKYKITFKTPWFPKYWLKLIAGKNCNRQIWWGILPQAWPINIHQVKYVLQDSRIFIKFGKGCGLPVLPPPPISF